MKKIYTVLLIASCFAHTNIQSESHTQKLKFELQERQRMQKSISKIRNLSAKCAAAYFATLFTLFYFISNEILASQNMVNIINGSNNINFYWSVPTAITTALYCLYNSNMIKEIENELLPLTDRTYAEEQE